MARRRGRGRLRTPVRGAYQRRRNRTKSMDERVGSHLFATLTGIEEVIPYVLYVRQ